jgi:hypothetical protein
MAKEIAEPSAEQEEAAEGDQVRVHHPGERLLREREVRADRRERDAHDRHVEDDHQIAETEDEEREPASVVYPSAARGLVGGDLHVSVRARGQRAW